jgi:hypothetical protein
MLVASAKVSKQIANMAAVVTNDSFRRLALLNATPYNVPPLRFGDQCLLTSP